MKIQNLKIEGFLSYQDKVEIDFTPFSLACIVGENGAGKSSLLDAMTWALFGKCRQSNESLINLQSDEAIVSFDFDYSGESYTIQRSNKRGKPARLVLKTPELDLTERTIRDTQNKIESILKIDYETFIHAVFFLQGESDQFVSANSSQRKQVLFDILGLDAWETFRLNAAGKIKEIERGMEQSRGVMGEIEETLLGEDAFKQDLETVKQGIKVASANTAASQADLDDKQKLLDEFTTWKSGQEELNKSFQDATNRVTDLNNRRGLLLNQQAENEAITGRKSQIVKDYARYQEVTELLARLDEKSTEWNKLNNDLTVLEQQLKTAEVDLAKIPELEDLVAEGEKSLELAAELTDQLGKLKNGHLGASTEVRKLRGYYEEKKDQLEELAGHDNCPLCEQKLGDPQKLIEKLESELATIKANGISAKDEVAALDEKIADIEAQLSSHNEFGKQVSAAKQMISQIQDRVAGIDKTVIAEFRRKLSELNYNAEEVTQLKQELSVLRNAPGDHGLLVGAEKIGDSLTVQIDGLSQDIFDTEATALEYKNKIESKKDKYTGDYELGCRSAVLLYTENLEKARADYDRETKKEGQIEAQLQNIEKQKDKLKSIKEKEKDNTALHQKYSILQEAFSKKGVPALLVEQALPQIESKANELLHRLSDGQMAVHFVTQKAYADGSRDDLKETLDIEIQDQAGIRDYEMYSGGESFRINFAIRMALSHVLANRAGAKLRTLVIDEGFGSQDAGGRDRLINAINIVKAEYDKVLVITHIPEVIEAFPVQLRVEKGSGGSKVRIL